MTVDGTAQAFQQCPESRVDVLWENWWVANLLWPLAAQLALTIGFQVAVRPLYVRVYRKSGTFKSFVTEHIGTATSQKVSRPRLLLALYATQIVSSCISVTVWVNRTYTRTSDDGDRFALLLAAMVDLLNWAVNRLRGEGSAWSLWEINGVVDALTVVPLLRCGLVPGACGSGEDWLSLHFLRSFSLPFNFRRIQETGCLRHWRQRILVLVHLALRVFCLIFVMAGTIFICELLGDPPWLVDSCILTAHGDAVSMAQMIYWIVISLTTVGYGDFAPKAMISRMLTAVFIVYGIGNVFMIQYTFTQLWTRYREGSGSYRPWRRSAPHIVVIFGVRGRASQLSSVLSGFLHEVLHPTHCEEPPNGDGRGLSWLSWLRGSSEPRCGWPNVVFLSPSLWEEDRSGRGENQQGSTFEDFLLAQKLPTEARRRVWFLVGNATAKVNLERAAIGSSALTIILTNMKSHMPDDDDGQNIYTAMLVHKMYPLVQLRLMLVRPESKNLAVQSGIEASSCFSARELTAHMLAQNVRCHGLLPLITGLFKSWDLEDVEQFLAQVQASQKTDAIRRNPTDSSKRGRSARTSLQSMQGMMEAQEMQNVQRMSMLVKGGAAARGSVRDRASEKTRKSHDSWDVGCEMGNFWMSQYFHGLSQSVHGFALAAEFDGQLFGFVANSVFQSTGAILLGVLEGDRLQICPQRTHKRPLRTGQICLALASCPGVLDPCRLRSTDGREVDWRRAMMASRDKVQKRTEQKGAHVAAMRVMGQQIRRRMNPGAGATQPLAGWRTSIREARDQPLLEKRLSTMTTGSVSGFATPMHYNVVAPTEVHGPVSTRQGGLAAEAAADIKRGLAQHDELTVVVVCNGEVWQQVRTFVQSLRAPFQPTLRPIIILAPTLPPAGLIENLGEGIACLKGSCLCAEDLFEAGVLEARAVVVMSGQHPSDNLLREPFFRDYQVVLCSQELECWCSFSDHEVFTAYELQDSRSVKYLPPVSSYKRRCTLQDALNESESLFEDLDTDVWAESPTVAVKKSGRASTAGSVLGASMGLASPPLSSSEAREAMGELVEDSILFNSRFASGQVFSPEVFGTLLGRMFYMPAIIELVEAVLMPHVRRQKAFVWQMRVPPEYVGQEFGELFRDLALGLLLPESEGESPLSYGRWGSQLSHSGSFSNLLRQRSTDCEPLSPESPPTRKRGVRRFDKSPTRSRNSLPNVTEGAPVITTTVEDRGDFQPMLQPGVMPAGPPPPLLSPAPPDDCLQMPLPRFDRQASDGASLARSCSGQGAELLPSKEKASRPSRRSSIFTTNIAVPLQRGSLISDGTVTDFFEGVGPAVPIALYRCRDENADPRRSAGTGGRNYSVLAPLPDHVLTSEDWLTVLGSKKFGHCAHAVGLLRGSPPRAAAEAGRQHPVVR